MPMENVFRADGERFSWPMENVFLGQMEKKSLRLICVLLEVFYHNFVNELVRALIVHWEEVFPSADELSGPLYDKLVFIHMYVYTYTGDHYYIVIIP